jgi:hypothetical protein
MAVVLKNSVFGIRTKNWPILPATESAEVEGESDKSVLVSESDRKWA